ncbi:Synaptonemal complex protein 1 [Morella rubra]|uniref:Synaptonemal complex protein 1 n=1 Tax=Morella rubra TaxID=262757 RepID=A0A6A1UUN7_9ROSI|nr:Synaptonemal complex protein 1 [Morella rubra]
MQNLRFPSMKSLHHFKSLAGSVSGTTKSFSLSSRPASDSLSSGSFANLKLTAEKLVKEQACVKTDLEMANAKLKKSMEHIRVLEEKLQNAFNENAKLKVKQKEDEKLWKGLESKLSSTKTLCDQLTETLQHLASQVQDAEKDKEFFEEKLSAGSIALDVLNQQMHALSLQLESAEETSRIHDMIKKFEETIAANRLVMESLNSKFQEAHLELKLKQDEIKQMIITQGNLEREKSDFQLCNDDLAKKLDMSSKETRNLEGLVQMLAAQLVELDKQSLNFSEKFDHLGSLYDSYFKLVQQETVLAAKHAKRQYDQLHEDFLSITSEKDALQLVNQELNTKHIELQKVQQSAMAQLSEECHLAGERIQKLESEAETLVSKKTETEVLVSKLEEKIDTLSESSRLSENKMQDLLLKISVLEVENKDNSEKLQSEIQKKVEEIDSLQKDGEKLKEHVVLLETQVSQLDNLIKEKEQLILQCMEREKKLEDQLKENQVLLTAAESKLAEAKKQYDQMLESKQLELSRHLKELSLRNDQAINDIQRKYEMEKLEIVNMEKEKADKFVGEIERKCNQELAESREEASQYLMRVQEEHATLVSRIQQEHDRKELALKADHIEELKRAQLLSENELREKATLFRNEHEAQMRALRCEHEDECRKLQEELDLQKSKDYSISSSKMKDSGGSKRGQHSLRRLDKEEKSSHFPEATQTPVSKLLKKVEDVNTGSVMSIPKHHKKVTHHEYEVETSNGRTITKRRKTKSTVMFEDPRKHKKMNTPKADTPKSIVNGVKGGGQPRPSNIGDLFSEGSLNPYADDPYAFD